MAVPHLSPPACPHFLFLNGAAACLVRRRQGAGQEVPVQHCLEAMLPGASSPRLPQMSSCPRGCVSLCWGTLFWVLKAAFLSWCKALIFLHPHKSQRFTLSLRRGSLLFETSGICAKNKIVQRMCDGEEERQIW